MREGLGSVFLYNLILVFIFIVFAFLTTTVSYAKAFRVSTKMTKILEKYEGYNLLSDAEIEKMLATMGYRHTAAKCPSNARGSGLLVQKVTNDYDYCIYLNPTDNVDKRHITYTILTYMYFDLPFGIAFKLPIYSNTDRIFCYKTSDTTCAR